ncbi:hypothetical protein RJD38_20085 [Vibrio scophthalmi]|uniref:Outer membrane protein beta-barrel domain-containing protein n=2 Tax=Vibrio scophthalmi TaxID=45658 RepID=F9RUM0_9VIBR|nr:hypothetical protein [Vibrio scophthalmi]ANU38508.1 hypothetical protein VSVS05_03470 [Vibrio scophthalmi]EGU30289.1 hypothetical protein VIS19158_07170 [Vibrio scophthalmi LMG 19158]
MKKWLLISFLGMSTPAIASDYLYLDVDSFLNETKGSILYGFQFKADNVLDFGYELEYSRYNDDTYSYGVNIKPSFHLGRSVYVSPIVGLHKFTQQIGSGIVYGGEVRYLLPFFHLKAGYKKADEEFSDNSNFFVGAGFRF